MKYFLPLFLLLQCSVVAQKPLFPAYDFFKGCDPAGEFAYLVTNAYYKPGGHTLDSTAIHQWISPMDSIQRFFFFASASFWVFDNSDTEQLMAYLPDYKQDFIKALHSLSFSPEEIACFDRLLEHLSSLKRLGAPFRTYYGCDISFRDEDHALLIHRFARAQFNRLFATDLFGQAGVDTRYTGLLSKKDGHLYYALQVKNGIPVMEEQRDSSDRVLQRSYFNAEGLDSCQQWFYPNGALWRENIRRPKERIESTYYITGKLFRISYQRYRDEARMKLDSNSVQMYREDGAPLFDMISYDKYQQESVATFYHKTAWDTTGQVCYSRGNGMLPYYELKDGRLHLQKQEMRLDSSLFFHFGSLLHWSDSTRAMVDAVAKQFLRTHPWANYRTDARTCLNHLTSATRHRLDSLQRAVLEPAFELICSVYAPWSPEDSIAPSERSRSGHGTLRKQALLNHFNEYLFSEATIDRIYQLEHDTALLQKCWYYPQKTGDQRMARSQWDVMAFRIQFLKQTATADELITWVSRRMIDIPYAYKRGWERETHYQRQYRIMLAVQDTMIHLWRPQLHRMRQRVWKQLSREDRAQILALREAWRHFIPENQALVDQYLYRTYRNQVPQRSAWYDSLYELMGKDYPSYRLMQLHIRRPAHLSQSELQSLSRNIYSALGKQREDLLQLEKALFRALAPCEDLWLSAYSWYWRGQDEEMLRALNLMLVE